MIKSVSETRADEFIRMLAIHIPLGLIIGLSIVAIHELYVILHEIYVHYIHLNHTLLIVFPVFAILSAFLLVHYLSDSDTTGGGSHRLLEVYHFEGGKMTLKSTIFEPLASAITIGLGGSAGFEGPSLLLGGGIGSLIGQRLKLTTDELSTILICGAAAGVSAIFKAPLTGIMFALEIPYKRDIYREAFIPATLSSASSYIVAVSLMKGESIFPLIPEIGLDSILTIHSIAVGILAGIVAILFVLLKEKVNQVKSMLHFSPIIIALIGGLTIGVLTFIFPEIAGTGYETLQDIMQGEIKQQIPWLVALLFAKIIATVLTLNTGGSGGVFVPGLFVGAILGQIYNVIVPNQGGVIIIVASMAAMISASNKTLLTSVALVAETTGPASVAYALLASATAYFLSGSISFYGHVQPEKELLEEEEALHTIFHHLEKKHHRLLEGIKIEELVRPNALYLHPETGIQEAVRAVKNYPFSVYPVVSDGILLGSTTLEDIMYLYENDGKSITISNHDPLIAEIDAELTSLVESLIEGEFDCIFVVKDIESMIFEGFISETDILLKLLEVLQGTL